MKRNWKKLALAVLLIVGIVTSAHAAGLFDRDDKNIFGYWTFWQDLNLKKSLIFEGTTDNSYETTLAVTNPTSDITITLPNQTGMPILSTAGAADTANAISGTSNGLVFEGATANGYETTFSPTDPTADRTVLIPNAGGTLIASPGAEDAANGFWGINNGLEFEGATADANDVSITVTDPTGDRAIIFPDASGNVILSTSGAFTGDVTGDGGDQLYGFNLETAAKTASYTLTAADSGKLITNTGASSDITITFGDQAVGFYVYICDSTADAYTIAVNPTNTDQIMLETNAAGDQISSTTSGGLIKLVQVSSTLIYPEGAANALWDDED